MGATMNLIGYLMVYLAVWLVCLYFFGYQLTIVHQHGHIGDLREELPG